MRRIMFLVVASCLFALFGALVGPAQAADYYRSYHRHGGYHHHWHVWHGDCCARPVIVYVPRERYLRLVEQMPFCAYCDNPLRGRSLLGAGLCRRGLSRILIAMVAIRDQADRRARDSIFDIGVTPASMYRNPMQQIFAAPPRATPVQRRLASEPLPRFVGRCLFH